MKLGICEWVAPVKGPAIFPKLKELGIDGIQLDDWDVRAQCNPLGDAYVQEIYHKASEESGIELIGMAGNSLGHEGGMIFPMETQRGRDCWETFTKSLDACASMALPLYLAPAFFEGTPRTQADRRRVVERMKDACHYADGNGVMVTLESIFPAEQLLRIRDEIEMPNFGVYYDTQNPVTYAGIDVPEDILCIGPGLIRQIHVKDGKNSIQGSCYLGEGETDFFRAAEAIQKIGYDGWIVLENYYSRPCFTDSEKSPWKRIEKDAAIARKAFGID